MQQVIHRGDVFWVPNGRESAGSEYYKTRPALIVSNEKNNSFSNRVEVVWLTTSNKKSLPTHVTLYAAPRISVALCECVTTIPKDCLEDYYFTVSEAEMAHIDRALSISLGLSESDGKPVQPSKPESAENPSGSADALRLSSLEKDYQLLQQKHHALLAQQAVYEKICEAFIPNWKPVTAENGSRV